MQRLRAWITDRPKSNWAQITSALIACAAVIGVLIQIRIGQHNAQLANARQVYMSYSEATLRYPEFADPDYDAIRQNRQKLAQYKTFVSHMLFAYDEMFSVSEQPGWVVGFQNEIADHKAYLCEQDDPRFYAQFYKRMRELLTQFKAANCK
jgi:hypothetical protein